MKNKRTIGYILMIIALIIPLYMLGSMSLDILAKENKYNKYLEEAKKENIYENGIMDKALEYNEKLGSNSLPVDPFEAENYKVHYEISDDPDAQFAYLTIPSIEVSEPVYLGATEYHLGLGFAHVDGTALPIGQKNTRSVIAGHRRTWVKLSLYHADQIEAGDILNLQIGDKVLKYKMISREIISPEEWEKLLPIEGKEIITILTCDPVPTYENRMVINFERVVEKADDKAKTPQESETQEETAVEITQTQESSISYRKYILFGICIFLILMLIVLVINLFKGKKKE